MFCRNQCFQFLAENRVLVCGGPDLIDTLTTSYIQVERYPNVRSVLLQVPRATPEKIEVSDVKGSDAFIGLTCNIYVCRRLMVSYDKRTSLLN